MRIFSFIINIIFTLHQQVKTIDINDIGLQQNSKGKFIKILQFTDLHYGEKESQDLLNDRILKSILNQEDPGIVIMTGDMCSGWVGEGKPGWFASQHSRWTQWFHKESNGLRDYPYLYTLGNHDHQADLSPSEIVALDQKDSLAQSSSMQGDSSTYYVLVKNGDKVLAAIISLYSGDQGCQGLKGYCGPSLEAADWQKGVLKELTTNQPSIKILVFFHIPQQETMLMQNNIKIQGGMNKDNSGCSSLNSGIFNISRNQQKNMIGFLQGHDHNNDFQGVWQDILLSQGRKTGQGSYGPPEGIQRGAKLLRLQLDESESIIKSFETQIRGEDGTVIEEDQQELLDNQIHLSCSSSLSEIDWFKENYPGYLDKHEVDQKVFS